MHFHVRNIIHRRIIEDISFTEKILRSFAKATEVYMMANGGQYPKYEVDLKDSLEGLPLNGKIIHDYQYTVSLSSSGYEIMAKPYGTKADGCAATEMKTMILKSGFKLEQRPCTK